MSKLVEKVFTYCGARLYMDWLLPTNPKSKNPVIKKWAKTRHWTFTNLENVHSGKIPGRRIRGALIWIALHALLWALTAKYMPDWFFLNLYINVYPIIVQLYIIYRCYKRTIQR